MPCPTTRKATRWRSLASPVFLRQSGHIDITLQVKANGIEITATASTSAQTGVEMEALTAASIAALTIYDMTKAIDKSIEIREVHLVSKTGGKSGDFHRRNE